MEDSKRTLLRHLLAYAVLRDVSLEQLARLSALDLGQMQHNPDLAISPKQWEDLWRNAVHLSKDPLLGLHFGESLQGVALGVVGQLIQTSRTVGEAFTQAAAFTHLVTDLFSLKVAQVRDTFTVHFIPEPGQPHQSPFVFRHLMDLFMAFTLHEADGLMLKKLTPLRVVLPHAEGDLREYERVLRCRPVIQPGEYALVFEGYYWEEPILTANYELQNLLRQQVPAAGYALTRTEGWRRRIENFLYQNAYLGILTLEAVAANFNTSPRTLQRKLQEEGATYGQLVEEVRKTLALQYLASGQYPLKEISYILGYNEFSAFSRAFKRWTGLAPVHYQSA